MAHTENSTTAVRLLFVTRQAAEFLPLSALVQANSWKLERADSGLEVLERIQSGDAPQLILLELRRGESDCLHTLRWIRRVRPELPVVLLSDAENNEQIVEAVRLGAQDYILRPCDTEALEKVLQRHLSRTLVETGDVASESIECLGDDLFFVSASESTRRLRARAELLAQINVPVLIVGENGSGKEMTARLIHKLSVRSGFKFAKINCGALPGELLDSELFGYERGAVNGAPRTKQGKLETCKGGTLLLEDIAEMPAPLQSKLVRVLQDNQFFRSGNEEPIPVDVRIIASTNLDAEKLVSQRRLREDLYYRLSAFTLQVPPLRQRKEEIPVLLGHLISRMAKHYALAPRVISPSVMDICQEHSWPGNLQELENFAKRYLVMGDNSLESELRVEINPLEGKPEKAATRHAAGSLKSLVRSAKGEAERNAISGALEQTHWNRKAAARLLSISYRALLYKIQEYQIAPPDYVAEFAADFGARSRNQ